MRPYLKRYRTSDGYNLFQLIHDDHLRGPQLLWNNGLRIPSIKLILSTIDVLAYAEMGDHPKIFQRWLDKYADLTRINANSEELWEFRNSLLHTNNNLSRKTRAGKIRTIIPYFGGELPESFAKEGPRAILLNGDELIPLALSAIENFCKQMQADSAGMEQFLERYDNIFSDSRFIDISKDPYEEILF